MANLAFALPPPPINYAGTISEIDTYITLIHFQCNALKLIQHCKSPAHSGNRFAVFLQHVQVIIYGIISNFV